MPFDRLSPLLQRHWLAATITLLWLAVTTYGFWYFEWQWQRQFENQHASFDLMSQPAPSGPLSTGAPLVVHFVDAGCPCTRFAEPHIEAVDAGLDPGVRTMRIYATDPQAGAFDWIPASPAVATWDGHGELAYVGPHSEGAFCGQGDDLVARVMGQLQTGNNPRWLNREAIGCFCTWQP